MTPECITGSVFQALTRTIGTRRKQNWSVLHSLVDQGAFASGTFVLMVLLARWLPPAEYALFAITYAVLILTQAVHTAIITEPMLVYGAAQWRQTFLGYFRKLIMIHIVGWGGLGCFAGGVAWLMGTSETGRLIGGLGLLLPLFPGLLLARRAFYVLGKIKAAAVGGAFYVAGLAIALSFLRLRDALTYWSAIGCLAFVATLVTGGLVATIWLNVDNRSQGGSPDLVTLLRQHWEYGRWAIPNGIARWVPDNLLYLLLPGLVSMQATAGYRAVMNIILPARHGYAALSAVIVPTVSRYRYNPQENLGSSTVRKLVKRAVGLSVLGGAVILIIAPTILETLYGAEYFGYSSALRIAAFLPAVFAGIELGGAVLRGSGRVDLFFRINFLGAVGASTIGILGIWLWGLEGAITSAVLVGLIQAILADRAVKVVDG